MISSASSPDRSLRADAPVVPGASLARAVSPRPDRISTEGAAFLRAELARQPAVRADVVARARMLAADPAYPPLDVLAAVAVTILASPDPGLDEA